MQIENLNPDDLTKAKTLVKELKKDNPEIKITVKPMEQINKMKEELEKKAELSAVIDKLDLIEAMLKRIFADHVLIRGQWFDLCEMDDMKRKE